MCQIVENIIGGLFNLQSASIWLFDYKHVLLYFLCGSLFLLWTNEDLLLIKICRLSNMCFWSLLILERQQFFINKTETDVLFVVSLECVIRCYLQTWCVELLWSYPYFGRGLGLWLRVSWMFLFLFQGIDVGEKRDFREPWRGRSFPLFFCR